MATDTAKKDPLEDIGQLVEQTLNIIDTTGAPAPASTYVPLDDPLSGLTLPGDGEALDAVALDGTSSVNKPSPMPSADFDLLGGLTPTASKPEVSSTEPLMAPFEDESLAEIQQPVKSDAPIEDAQSGSSIMQCCILAQ